MKFVLTFKTPDVRDEMEDIVSSKTDDYYDLLSEMKSLTDKFLYYGEVIQIEFDTETQTAIVQKAAK